MKLIFNVYARHKLGDTGYPQYINFRKKCGRQEFITEESCQRCVGCIGVKIETDADENSYTCSIFDVDVNVYDGEDTEMPCSMFAPLELKKL